jgi:anti-sigma factor RsiW
MNSHLSDSELTDHLLGFASEESQLHLERCPACRKELSRLQESIQLFRTAAIKWSENQELNRTTLRTRKSGSVGRLVMIRRFAVVAALVVFAVIVGFHLKDHQPILWRRLTGMEVISSDTRSQSQIAKDNELLSRLTSELSENVPAPMQPLQISQISQEEQNDH